MAEISILVDTTKKTFAVNVDGKKISNVHEAHIFTEAAGFFGVDVVTLEDVGDLKKVTRLVASEEDPAELVATTAIVENYEKVIDAIHCSTEHEDENKYTPEFIAGLSEALGQ